jgi:GDP-L-fucose synthase
MAMEKNDRIYVAGHRGLAGSAIIRELRRLGFSNLIVRSKQESDLTKESVVMQFFEREQPDYVFLAAAKVGGILANSTYPVDFLRDNLLIQTNVVAAAHANHVKKLAFLGSSCIYPRLSPQPIKEEYLMDGPLESTNEWYAIAKISGIKLCQAYHLQYGFRAISLMPTNLYGPGDNFDLKSSHVLPALIRKFHTAHIEGRRSVRVWGTGKPRREFLHVDDLASAVVFLMQRYDEPGIINVGTGQDVTISELACTVAEVIGYTGKIDFDASIPDGTPRKLLDVSRIHSLGWRHTISLADGIRSTYTWLKETAASNERVA